MPRISARDMTQDSGKRSAPVTNRGALNCFNRAALKVLCFECGQLAEITVVTDAVEKPKCVEYTVGLACQHDRILQIHCRRAG
jgi:hypothetical protein